MNKLIAVLSVIALSIQASAQDGGNVSTAEKEIPEYSALELLEVWGWLVGEQFNLAVLDLNEAEVDAIADGIRGYVKTERPNIDFEHAVPQLQKYVEARESKVRDEQMKRGRDLELEFFDAMVGEPNIQALGTGLHFEILDKGSDVLPRGSDTVKVHYRGTLLNGKEFDSSYSRNEPSVFRLDQVIQAWTQGLQLIGVGGKIKLYAPAALAYGDQGTPGIPPASTLIFEVELLEILDTSAVETAPVQ